MRKLNSTMTFVIAVISSLLWISLADAQVQPVTTTALCNSLATCATAQLPNVNAATLRRATGDVLGRSRIAVLIMHPHSGYTGFAACAGLTQRGFTTLCINGPFNGNQFGYYGLEQSVPPLRSAMNYLRNIVAGPAITKVILLGHSGGGALMTFYQNIAENGPSACTGPEKILPCVADNLNNLPKADGVISFDGHPDITGVDLLSSNTSTVNNLQGITVPALFVANGAHYFIRHVELEYELAKSNR